jgi:hypothetical protein
MKSGFIEESLKTGWFSFGKDHAQKSGHTITYTAVVATPITEYTILAAPQSTSTGQRKFFTDQSGVIRQTTDGSTPTASSTPIG